MGHFARLQLVGKVTYYLGWISLLCGGIFHFNIARSFFFSIDLTQRNLFEVAVVCFLICVASELRAQAPAGTEAPGVMKKAA